MNAPRALSTLTADAFDGWLGDGWQLTTADGSVWPLRLKEVKITGAYPYQPGGRLPFRLTFEGAPELRLPQATYRATREGWGETELFLVPLQPGRSSLFEAVFS